MIDQNSKMLSDALTPRKVASIQFNQDRTLFSIADERGYEVFTADPLHSLRRVMYDDGGLSSCALMNVSNLLALVGGGDNPKYPPNRIILFDDHQEKEVAQIELRAEVKAVKMRPGLLVAALHNRVFIYWLKGKWQPVFLGTFEARRCDDQERLAVSVSDKIEGESDEAIVAFPGQRPGSVQIVRVNFKNTKPSTESGEEEDKKQDTPQIVQLGAISAHDSQVVCVAITPSGDKIATASQKGTIIRIFLVSTSRLIGEFRRGIDPAIITSMAFNEDGTRLVVCSEKGTIHIFNLTAPVQSQPNPTTNNLPDLLKPILPKSFQCTYSFASVHQQSGSMVASFQKGEPNNLLVVRHDGLWFKYVVDENRGGEAVLVASKAF